MLTRAKRSADLGAVLEMPPAVEEKKEVLVQEKKDAVEERKRAVEEMKLAALVQESPAKKPRCSAAGSAAAAEEAAPEPAESHGSLSQETLVMDAGSPVVEDLEDARRMPEEIAEEFGGPPGCPVV